MVSTRDVSLGLQYIRNFLLGRKSKRHNRFPHKLAPRSIPQPDVPRGPEYKYSNQYYHGRSAFDSVKPPVVAPVALGPPIGQDSTKKGTSGGISPECICFHCAPTPGPPWWWDGHFYYECLSTEWNPPQQPQPCPKPKVEKSEECASPSEFPPPCPRSPDSGPRH